MTPPCRSEDSTEAIPDKRRTTPVDAVEGASYQQGTAQVVPFAKQSNWRAWSYGPCAGGLGREQVKGLGQDLIDGDIGDERGVVG